MVHLLRVVVVVIAVETFFELPFGFLLFPNSRCWKCRKPDLKLHLILKPSHFSRTCGWRLENTKKPWVFSITNDYFTFYEIFGKKPLHLQSNNSDGKVKYFSFSVRCDVKHRESCRISPRLNFLPFPMFNTYSYLQ